MSPATAKLECLDCKDPIAVGLPVRVISSWVGSCTNEGYTAFFHQDEDSGVVEWRRTPFSRTKECDEHHYKLAVKCSSKCVIRAIDSPVSSTVKLLGVYPLNPGNFTFTVEMRRSEEGEVVAQLASAEFLVRAPDEISPFAEERPIDGASKRATFGGYEYFLEPGSARAGDPPDRGTKYRPAPEPEVHPAADVDKPMPPERFQRVCKTRTPGAIAWRPCSQGVQAGDDVRIDVTAWRGTERMAGDVSLGEPGFEWTCYRTSFVPGAQICVRYGVPAGEHALSWRGLAYTFDETLVVGGAP